MNQWQRLGAPTLLCDPKFREMAGMHLHAPECMALACGYKDMLLIYIHI